MDEFTQELRALYERFWGYGEDGAELLDAVLETAVALAAEQGDDIIRRYCQINRDITI